MSLLKRLTLTPRKLEANQANAQLSQGPATAEGIERIRDAQVVHGFYSKAPGEALRALGEKPDDFECLLAALTETWQPENDYERMLVRRLARALWRVERADRIQEAMTVAQVERVSMHIEEQAERAAAAHKEKTGVLERLLQQVQHAGFYASASDLRDLEQVLGSHPKGRQAEMIYLVWRLMRPSDPAANILAAQGTEAGPGATPNPDGALESRAASGMGGPDLAPATGRERDRRRSELRWLLRQEIEAEQNAYRQKRDWRAREITPAAMDAAMAPDDPQADRMLRAETAAFRQVKQITEMLTQFRQIRRQGQGNSEKRQEEGPPEIKNEGKSHDVVDNKGPSSETER
ncbi:MAG TPA: hypothetical protein VGZ29_07830 [Terriglobia bacterium]|nr:hypothetical protein [Terriglobia bacterium]